jgi:lambda family phage minor tail protein L
MRIVGNAFKTAKNAPLVRPIFLYSILYDKTSNAFKRYTNWPGGVTFDGIDYEHFPIVHDSITEDTTGQIQKASLAMLNVTREVQALLDDNDGLRGCPITIMQVWEDTIDDPTAFIADMLNISDCTITEANVTFSLSSVLDVLNIKLPRRALTRNFCRFRFKGEECAYAGAETNCDKTLNRCRELQNSNRFGGFPATPAQRVYFQGG